MRVYRHSSVGLRGKRFPTLITSSFTIATRFIWPARVKITLEVSQTSLFGSSCTLVFRRRHSSHFIQPLDPNLLFPLTEILLLAVERMSVIPFPVAHTTVPCSTIITRRSWHIRIALWIYTILKRGGRFVQDKGRALGSDFERKGESSGCR